MNQRKDDDVIERVERKLDAHIHEEEEKDAARDKLLAEIKENTKELVELWSNAKGAIAVIRITGNFIKWALPIVVTVGAFLAWVKGDVK